MRLGEKFKRFRAFGVIRGRTNKVPQEKKVGSGRYKARRSPLMLYWKGGPTFSKRLPQWDMIAEIGKKCGEKLRGITDWKERKEKLRECVAEEFSKIRTAKATK